MTAGLYGFRKRIFGRKSRGLCVDTKWEADDWEMTLCRSSFPDSVCVSWLTCSNKGHRHPRLLSLESVRKEISHLLSEPSWHALPKPLHCSSCWLTSLGHSRGAIYIDGSFNLVVPKFYHLKNGDSNETQVIDQYAKCFYMNAIYMFTQIKLPKLGDVAHDFNVLAISSRIFWHSLCAEDCYGKHQPEVFFPVTDWLTWRQSFICKHNASGRSPKPMTERMLMDKYLASCPSVEIILECVLYCFLKVPREIKL